MKPFFFFLRGNKVTTSISAALSCPKKTFLMNFPSRNTSTNAWMYNTWWHKHNCGLTVVKTSRYLFCSVRKKTKRILLFVCGYTYCHAGATLGEVDHRGIELVLKEVSMGHHSPSQGQTGGSHQDCSHHLGSRCRSWEGRRVGWQKIIQKKRKEKLILSTDACKRGDVRSVHEREEEEKILKRVQPASQSERSPLCNQLNIKQNEFRRE